VIDGNELRTEFARYLSEHTHTRWGLDAALMHVCKIAYQQGVKDGKAGAVQFDDKAGFLPKDEV
jgi:hypothetical protein